MTLAGAIVLIALCLVLQGLYSGAETALSSARRSKLEEQADEGNTGAALALDLLRSEERMFGTCLLGTTLCLVAGTTLVAWALRETGVTALWAAVLVYAPIALVFGEAVPRIVHLHRATVVAPYAARFVSASGWLFAPALPVVRGWARLLARLTGTDQRTALTRQEILLLLQRPADPGVVEPEEHEMIRRVFAIGETVVEECMTPLVDVDAIASTDLARDATAVALRNGHTRIPVFEERVDHIVGIVHARDLLGGVERDAPVTALLRPVKYVPESKRVDELLHEMRREREPFAIVVDEYGGSVGIVTVEDLLEELIGDIRDEREHDEHGIRKLAEGEWRVPARVEIDELEDAIGTRLPEGDYETVAGLVLAVLGRIPQSGEVVRIDDVAIRVEEANERAIQTLHVSLKPAAAVLRTR